MLHAVFFGSGRALPAQQTVAGSIRGCNLMAFAAKSLIEGQACARQNEQNRSERADLVAVGRAPACGPKPGFELPTYKEAAMPAVDKPPLPA